ncbi:globin [Salicola sp. Rm-C-2C1-2]|uniref:globin n=1 Tax=Salicola sp. Rm-C-2C1-2 TaxID=3141321 RepID=UPI0032E4B9BF
MDSSEVEAVFQSYGRVCTDEQFFIDFYDYFMSSSQTIKDQFRDTDMKQQRHLLRNGIMQLILYARGMPDTKLKQLAETHSRHGYDIAPEWYSIWLDALMKAVAKHDSEYDASLDAQWRRVLKPGIDLIRDAY